MKSRKRSHKRNLKRSRKRSGKRSGKRSVKRSVKRSRRGNALKMGAAAAAFAAALAMYQQSNKPPCSELCQLLVELRSHIDEYNRNPNDFLRKDIMDKHIVRISNDIFRKCKY